MASQSAITIMLGILRKGYIANGSRAAPSRLLEPLDECAAAGWPGTAAREPMYPPMPMYPPIPEYPWDMALLELMSVFESKFRTRKQQRAHLK